MVSALVFWLEILPTLRVCFSYPCSRFVIQSYCFLSNELFAAYFTYRWLNVLSEFFVRNSLFRTYSVLVCDWRELCSSMSDNQNH